MASQAEQLLDKFEDMERAVERDLRRTHKRLKQRIPSYLLESRPLNLLGAPVIYSMIVPIDGYLPWRAAKASLTSRAATARSLDTTAGRRVGERSSHD